MTLRVHGRNLDPGEALRPHVSGEVANRFGGRVNGVDQRRDGAMGWLDPQASRDPPGAA